jgi:hypothetical protein
MAPLTRCHSNAIVVETTHHRFLDRSARPVAAEGLSIEPHALLCDLNLYSNRDVNRCDTVGEAFDEHAVKFLRQQA